MLLGGPQVAPPPHQFATLDHSYQLGRQQNVGSPLTSSRRFSNSAQNLRRECEFGSEDKEDASEIYSLLLTGGPKWGFRIKQLNDNRVIVSRIDKGPAEKSGLRVYDELLAVNNVELSNQPRSLLLYDYPNREQHQMLASGSAPAEKSPLLASVGSHAGDNSAELGPLSLGDHRQAPAAGSHYMRAQIHLSKLDFAYQLIKHSSASNNNKLLLTVRRFLNASYARASALAATNTLAACNFSSSREYRQSLAGFELEPNRAGQQEAGQSDGWPAETLKSLSNLDQNRRHSIKRPHTATGNVYKCCDCYCDQQGEFDDKVAQNDARIT